MEHSPFGRRGYYASFPLQGTQAAAIIAAAVFLPLSAFLSKDDFKTWGWRIPFFLSAVVVAAGYVIRRRVDETLRSREEAAQGEVVKAPVVQVFRENGKNILRAVCMALVNVVGTTVVVFGAAYATQAGYGVGMSTTLYLWIPIAANIVAIILIPYFGSLSDRIGRRPLMICGALGAGMLSIPYLFAVSQKNEVLAIVLAILTVGVFYQAWNATFASFFQELFPTRTRVTGFAISQNIGLAIVAFLPTVFAVVAPPGSTHVPLIIGSMCLAITVIGAVAAWSAPETYRIHLNDLGKPDATRYPRRVRTHPARPSTPDRDPFATIEALDHHDYEDVP